VVGSERVELVDIVLLVQTQNPGLAQHELLAEHQLCNMGASDFGSHSAMPHEQAAIFCRWVYQILLLSRRLTVSSTHVESFKRVTSNQVLAMQQWGEAGKNVGGQALHELQHLLSQSDLDKLTAALQRMVENLNEDTGAVSLSTALSAEAAKVLE
jgi:hypothetical protein